ncbi:MAG: hypothetical protein AAGK04_11545, partial [Planctomycetota bacterium]
SSLAACYQCAGLHLHADLQTLTHQRVLECALSGGLIGARFNLSGLVVADLLAAHQIMEANASVADPDEDPIGYDPDPHSEASRLWSVYESMGMQTPSRFRIHPSVHNPVEASNCSAFERLDATRLLDPIAEGTFDSPETLEALCLRARDDDDWRRERIATMRERVRRGYSYHAFASEMLSHVARATSASLDRSAV